MATDLEPPVVTVSSPVESVGPGFSYGPIWTHGVHPYRLHLVARDNLGVSEVWVRFDVVPIAGDPLGSLVPASPPVREAAEVFSDSALCTRLGVSDTFYVDLPAHQPGPRA